MSPVYETEDVSGEDIIGSTPTLVDVEIPSVVKLRSYGLRSHYVQGTMLSVYLRNA
jgi:hypothetical protein